jgi:SAM-dependent methyltransferase
MNMNQSTKQLLKDHTPVPVWNILRRLASSPAAFERQLKRKSQIREWKKILKVGTVPRSTGRVDSAMLENSLPNSGGIPADPVLIDPARVAKANSGDDSRRASGFAGFEGLALDDALGWLEPYRHYSFVPLAQAISRIAASHLNRSDFSVLELGCGGGGFRVLLENFGASSYLGVDANPLPFFHSPYMLQAPRNYRLLNLQETINFGTSFDVVCSFEVLEHIREDRLDCMLASIANHMSPESIFLGTAALTDCFDVHITVHPREWWIEQFARHGIVPVDGVQESAWMDLLAQNHPFNWNASSTSILVLRRASS